MNTPFKAMDRWLERGERSDLCAGLSAIVEPASYSPFKDDDTPCTIIPGHWAAKIESGELLTEEEVLDVFDEYVKSRNLFTIGYTDFGVFLSKYIARKLRAEA